MNLKLQIRKKNFKESLTWHNESRNSNNATECLFFYVGHLLLSMQSTLKRSLFLQTSFLVEKKKFHFKLLLIEDSFCGRNEGMGLLLLSELGPHLVQTRTGPEHATSVSMHSFVLNSRDLDVIVLVVSSILSGSYTLFASAYPLDFDSWREEFDEKNPV